MAGAMPTLRDLHRLFFPGYSVLRPALSIHAEPNTSCRMKPSGVKASSVNSFFVFSLVVPAIAQLLALR
jgi:hypothetical protein